MNNHHFSLTRTKLVKVGRDQDGKKSEFHNKNNNKLYILKINARSTLNGYTGIKGEYEGGRSNTLEDQYKTTMSESVLDTARTARVFFTEVKYNIIIA